MEKPSYYAVIPAKIRYDDRLRANEKLIYGEITSLSNKDGKCWASNSYFAKLYKVSTSTISTWINNLANNGYLELTYVYKGNTKELDKREITLVEEVTSIGIHKKEIGIHKKIIGIHKIKKGYSQNLKENNTSINNKKEEEGNFQKDLKDVIEFYENNITLITPTVAEDMEQYLKDGIKADLMIDAMKEAVDRNKKNWKYSVGILNNCLKDKIYTSKQFKIMQEEFKSSQNLKRKEIKPKEKIEYEEIKLTNDEEYLKKVLGKG